MGCELPDGRDEAGYAVAQLLFGGAGALVCGPGFFGYLLDALAEAPVGFAELVSHMDHAGAELVDLALGVTPELAVLLAVLTALFRDGGGDALNAVEAFFGGHGSVFLSGERGRHWRAASSLCH